jgi:hypothetical protein
MATFVGVIDVSKWARTWFCVGCKSELTWSQKVNNTGCCPLCGHLSDSTICETVTKASEVSTAWTITKLKVVRALLAPLLKWHVKREAKIKNKEHDGC